MKINRNTAARTLTVNPHPPRKPKPKYTGRFNLDSLIELRLRHLVADAGAEYLSGQAREDAISAYLDSVGGYDAYLANILEPRLRAAQG